MSVVHCKKEPYDVYIGRPSKWGNPFSHKEGTLAQFKVATVQDAVEEYRKWIVKQPDLMNDLDELRGMTLGCWCKPGPCHGDVLMELAERRLVMGKGPKPAKLMIVGEAPGETEDRVGEPFVGRSGKVLDDALSAAGLDRSTIYITNVYKHRPPNNRKPTWEELASHADILQEELNEVQPEVVLLLGGTALEVFTGMKTVGSARGVNLMAGLPCALYATYHPSYTFRSKEAKEALFEDVKAVGMLVHSSDSVPLVNR